MNCDTRVVMILVLGFLACASSVSAQVFLNEIELNPAGSDGGHQWIELYSPEVGVNISNWYIQNSAGENYSVGHDATLTYFFVIDGLSGFASEDEQLLLYTADGVLEDGVGSISDSEDDERTWQRLPDGAEEFNFSTHTRGAPNEEPMVTLITSLPACVLQTDTVTLSADVTGTCVKDITFVVQSEGQTRRVNGSVSGDTYSAVLPSSFFDSEDNVRWYVEVSNCVDEVFHSDEAHFFPQERTQLHVTPALPNGLNGWYVTRPLFTLENPDAALLYYQWDSSSEFIYENPFHLEQAPNTMNTTGGMIDLHYRSNVCPTNLTNREPDQHGVFRFDFTAPVVRNIQPAPGSSVHERRPILQVRADELYRSNSGVDPSSIVFTLDGENLSPSVEEHEDLDARISATPLNDLSLGLHFVEISVKDRAGHTTSQNWSFRVSPVENISVQVFSPLSGVYTTRRIPFNVSLTGSATLLEFIDMNDSRGRLRRLCTNCMSYGFDRARQVTFSEGAHTVFFQASDANGYQYGRADFFVDTLAPLLRSVTPKRGFTNGTFVVQLQEQNPISLSVEYGSTDDMRVTDIPLSACVPLDSRGLMSCSFYLNLTDFSHSTLSMHIRVEDIAHHVTTSPAFSYGVDVTPPVMGAVDSSINRRIVRLTLPITEEHFAYVTVQNPSISQRSEKRLCTRLVQGICSGTATITSDTHSLILSAYDAAGNRVDQTISL